MRIRAIALMSALTLSACNHLPMAEDQMPAKPAEITNAAASIIDGTGSEIGNAVLTGGPNGIMVRVELSAGSISPGWHGIHFHQIGDCSDLGVFKRSGGHMGLIEGGHGLMNPIGPESGDIPNIYAHADGSAGYEIFTLSLIHI